MISSFNYPLQDHVRALLWRRHCSLFITVALIMHLMKMRKKIMSYHSFVVAGLPPLVSTMYDVSNLIIIPSLVPLAHCSSSLSASLRTALSHLLPHLHLPSITLITLYIPKLTLSLSLSPQGMQTYVLHCCFTFSLPEVRQAIKEVVQWDVPLSLNVTEGIWDTISPLCVKVWYTTTTTSSTGDR